MRPILLAVAALSSQAGFASVVDHMPSSQQVTTAWLNRQMSALAERGARTGWHVTASGLRWRQVAGDGKGIHPGAKDKVTVHYVGTFVDGSEFDSSFSRGEPTSFFLRGVIAGWTEGLQLMGVGDRFEFAVPYQLGYGALGRDPIPGGATMLFTIELLAVED